MRKRFIRVAVFCALTAVAAPVLTGCSDYDDDITSLQQQIDQVKELPHISTADMTAAINSAIETLQGEMETAINGKADNADVVELQKLVGELTTLANGKADASTVADLSGRIDDLITKVNETEGSLNQKLTDLQEEIGTLQEDLSKAKDELAKALENKADASKVNELQESISAINKTLADRLTEFNTVKDMAENNGKAIAEIQSKLTELETLKNDISDLQEANLEHVGKFQSIDTRLEGIDEKMDELSARIDEIMGSSTTAGTIQDITSRLQALEDYKAQTLEALVTQANADHTQLAAALSDIATLKADLSKYVTLEGLQANYYDKEAVDSKFSALDDTLKDLGLLKNMIQSVVYVPNADASYGQTMFYQLRVKNRDNAWQNAAQNKTTKVQFRVSPAKYAENFADKYDVKFDGFKMNRAASTFLTPSNIVGDPKTGIVTMDVDTDIPAGDVYAVCLKVTPKATNEADKYSNLTTNYFGVQHALLDAADIKTYCDNMNSGSLNFKGEQTVNYLAGRKYYGYDEKGNALAGGQELTTIFGTEPFVTTYDFARKSHESTFVIGQNDGVLGIDENAKGSVAIIGRTVTAEANTSVSGIRTFTTTYKQIEVTDVELSETLTLNASDFKNFTGLKWSKDEQKFELSDAAYIRIFKQEGMMGDEQFFTYEMEADNSQAGYLEVDKENKKIYFVIPKQTAIDKSFSTTLTVQYGSTSTGAQRKYVITCNVNAPMTYPSNTLHVDEHFWVLPENGGHVIFQPKTTLNDAGQITGIDFSMNLESAFLGYTDDKHAIETAGGSVDGNWKIATPTGTSVSGHTLTIDKSQYQNGALSMATEIKWGTHSEHKYAADIVVEGFSGSWEAGKTEIYVRDRNEKNVKISDGFIWKDMWGYTMWKDGVAQYGNNTTSATYHYATQTDPFTSWGLTKPTYELVNASDSKYVTINSANGTLNFTEEGKTWALVQPLEIKVRVKAASRWGAIDNYNDNTSIITIIVQN